MFLEAFPGRESSYVLCKHHALCLVKELLEMFIAMEV